jgi:transposase
MSLQAESLPPVASGTSQVARAAFPEGNVYMQMRDELDSIYDDEMFTTLYAQDGQPALNPWRLALVSVMQFAENLSDSHAGCH